MTVFYPFLFLKHFLCIVWIHSWNRAPYQTVCALSSPDLLPSWLSGPLRLAVLEHTMPAPTSGLCTFFTTCLQSAPSPERLAPELPCFTSWMSPFPVHPVWRVLLSTSLSGSVPLHGASYCLTEFLAFVLCCSPIWGCGFTASLLCLQCSSKSLFSKWLQSLEVVRPKD